MISVGNNSLNDYLLFKRPYFQAAGFRAIFKRIFWCYRKTGPRKVGLFVPMYPKF